MATQNTHHQILSRAGASPIVELRDIPVHVCVLWPDAESAKDCPRGDMLLTVEPDTGVLSNSAFEPAKMAYVEGYENSLSFSEFFQGYLTDLAQDLVDRHNLNGKTVVEVGAGDGEFISLLCTLGKATGIGFEPSWVEDRPLELAGGAATIRREIFPPEGDPPRADLVVSRQVLEHVPEPREFLRAMRAGMSAGATLVLEVPSARDIMRRGTPWEMIYEHVLYFTPGSLARLLVEEGFDVVYSRETYEGQFVLVEARVSEGATGSMPADLEDRDELGAELAIYRTAWRTHLRTWESELAAMRESGKRVALWGAGARGVNFLNFGDTDRVVERVVDLNTRKHGRHVAGSGQRVDAPESLAEWKPDVVILTNPIYVDEVRGMLAELGITPEVRVA